jgi:hypothetical protein
MKVDEAHRIQRQAIESDRQSDCRELLCLCRDQVRSAALQGESSCNVRAHMLRNLTMARACVQWLLRDGFDAFLWEPSAECPYRSIEISWA